jgi:hypothetical protein
MSYPLFDPSMKCPACGADDPDRKLVYFGNNLVLTVTCRKCGEHIGIFRRIDSVNDLTPIAAQAYDLLNPTEDQLRHMRQASDLKASANDDTLDGALRRAYRAAISCRSTAPADPVTQAPGALAAFIARSKSYRSPIWFEISKRDNLLRQGAFDQSAGSAIDKVICDLINEAAAIGRADRRIPVISEGAAAKAFIVLSRAPLSPAESMRAAIVAALKHDGWTE